VKTKINPSKKGLLILFSLLASAILIPSEYVDDDDLLPDENLEFLGTSAVSPKPSFASRVFTFVLSSFTPHLFGVVFFSPLINSRMALATILRC